MNMLFERLPLRLIVVLSQLTAGIVVLGSGLTAQAETINKTTTASNQPSVNQETATRVSNPVPQPGTTATASDALQPHPTTKPAETKETADPQVAQVDIDPGRPTRGVSSYIAVGVNIGLDGETSLGDGNFAVTSKIGFANFLSLRPGAVIGDNVTFLIPITYDIALGSFDEFEDPVLVVPYVGAGVAISTGSDEEDDNTANNNDDDDDDDSDVGPLLTAGVDFPITDRFTATAAVNVAFFDDTDVGLLLGIGYNFGAF